jgi:hypothetical protein
MRKTTKALAVALALPVGVLAASAPLGSGALALAGGLAFGACATLLACALVGEAFDDYLDRGR